ncbi:MAG: cell division protein FtsW [Candidatus Pacebacteria bacterium]|nr:cell division protein FtsW [Candidatus Paceibacterota bacterium]MBP9780402.1 cell division protein FtsW [Candidatus Paceibacterota bacterium]MDQ5949512.1 putative lipid flippase FtsW [Patescibacteria group bacterium]
MLRKLFQKSDKVFLGITLSLVVIGVVVFVSASLGILARSEQKFYGVVFNQILFGVIFGMSALVIMMNFDYQNLRKYAFHILVGTLILTALVFVPGLSYEHGGARRWISIGSIQFQPAEFLKIGFVIYFAAWLTWMKNKVHDFKKTLLPFSILLLVIAGILLRQPDTKSLILIVVAGVAMCIVAGVPWKYVLGFTAVAAVAFVGFAFVKGDYLKDRISTFIRPSDDTLGKSWQITQSLNAIGSGEMFGRGLGQSVQKFGNLPEPQGDSIFAVLGEEFGFIGTTIVVILYLFFALRGLRIASHAPDQFGKLLATGLIVLILGQSYLNIASLVGLFPLTGVPLVFMSHGGTSMMIALAATGIVLNISKAKRAQSQK